MEKGFFRTHFPAYSFIIFTTINRMKTKLLKSTFLVLAASVILLMTMSSCAVKTRFLTSEIVPAAQGTVQIKVDKNKNYVIVIEMSNLSPSTRLTPPRNAYVVWMINSDNNTLNLGQINSSENFMSNNLTAKFETVSSSRPVKVFITAENEPGVNYPSFSEVILTTDYLTVR